MSKRKTFVEENDIENLAAGIRQSLTEFYTEKYFNLYLNNYDWKGLSHDQREFLLRRFWFDGYVGAFAIIDPKTEFMMTNATVFQKGLLGFAPLSEFMYNIYGYPTRAVLINTYGAPYIPQGLLQNHVDVVFGFAQHDRQPLAKTVETLVSRIVNCDMKINTNLAASSIGMAVECGPDSKVHAEDLMHNLSADNPNFYVNVGEADSLKGVGVGAPFIANQIQLIRDDYENKLKTFLGLDNSPMPMQDAQRVVGDAINANNDEINDSGDSILDCFKEFCKDIKADLGFDVSVSSKRAPVKSIREEGKDDEKGDRQNDRDN